MVFRAKGVLTPHGLDVKPPPPSNQRKRGGHAKFVDETLNKQIINTGKNISEPLPKSSSSALTPSETLTPVPTPTPPPQSRQLSDNEVLERISKMEPLADTKAVVQENLYCPECYLPLHPDPKPERLYIFLHALRYTTSLGSFETGMPEWAVEGWTWDRS